jgi:Sulfotransferase family
MTASVETSPRGVRLVHGGAPDFFIVGHAKCGTTALYHMLKAHPQIFMPALKETRFFALELHARPRDGGEHPTTLEEYAALFAAAAPGQRTGEASPSYIRSEHAAARIAQLRPDARIIAILREPASFLHSLHLQLVQAQVETEKDLRRALAREGARREARARDESAVQQGVMYREHVRYVQQLRRFHDAFPREQVMVIIYDDFRADNERTVKSVLRFVGVDDRVPIAAVQAHPSVRVRSPRMHRMVNAVRMGRGPVAATAKAAIKLTTSRRMRRGAVSLSRRAQLARPQSPDERFTLELRRQFKDEVVALSEYLDRDLVALWGYDRIG